jgi:hypothetical protein
MAEQAERGIRSVVARDAVTVVPVQAAEVSRVVAPEHRGLHGTKADSLMANHIGNCQINRL